MSKLVVMIDGSHYTKSVCDHAAWAARTLGVGIELLHVLPRPDGSSAPADLSGNLQAEGRSALLNELAELDAQQAKLAKKRGRLVLEDAKTVLEADGITDVSVKLRHGDLLEAVSDFEADAEFLVIGKRGETADMARLHLGSNLERVVRASHKPVLVASRAFTPIKKFMIAFDGGATALKAVDYISRSPLFSGAECRILTVGRDDQTSAKKLDAAASLLRGGGFTVDTAVESGKPEEVITRHVETDGIDLVVMGAYGHSRIRTLIIGSTTSEMIRGCKVPILLFR